MESMLCAIWSLLNGSWRTHLLSTDLSTFCPHREVAAAMDSILTHAGIGNNVFHSSSQLFPTVT